MPTSRRPSTPPLPLQPGHQAKSEDWVRNRLAKNAYDPACSAGAFDDGRLVGFMLHGVADWRGERIAFDAATGILPQYRGQGLAGRPSSSRGRTCANGM